MFRSAADIDKSLEGEHPDTDEPPDDDPSHLVVSLDDKKMGLVAGEEDQRAQHYSEKLEPRHLLLSSLNEARDGDHVHNSLINEMEILDVGGQEKEERQEQSLAQPTPNHVDSIRAKQVELAAERLETLQKRYESIDHRPPPPKPTPSPRPASPRPTGFFHRLFHFNEPKSPSEEKPQPLYQHPQQNHGREEHGNKFFSFLRPKTPPGPSRKQIHHHHDMAPGMPQRPYQDPRQLQNPAPSSAIQHVETPVAGMSAMKRQHNAWHFNAIFGGHGILSSTSRSRQGLHENKKTKPQTADKEEDAYVIEDPLHGDGWKVDMRRSASESSLWKRYEFTEQKVIGKGANSVVKACHVIDHNSPPEDSDKWFAIKEFRVRRKGESERAYIKKIANEFCISSFLHHPNIIETVDFLQDVQNHWCEVMEFCPGGDLCTLIQHGALPPAEANCFFAQLINGVDYLHSRGVAHRDLKPENLMLDATGCLKISDFGEAEVFQTPWENHPHLVHGICGSGPYIAPEEFTQKEFDPCLVDIWACGIIYLTMLYNRIPWRQATLDDPNYRYFYTHRLGSFSMIDRLPRGSRNLLNHILEPDPSKRIHMEDIKNDPWFKEIVVCTRKVVEREPSRERLVAEKEKEKVGIPLVIQPPANSGLSNGNGNGNGHEKKEAMTNKAFHEQGNGEGEGNYSAKKVVQG